MALHDLSETLLPHVGPKPADPTSLTPPPMWHPSKGALPRLALEQQQP